MQAAETATAEAMAMDVLHPHHFPSSASSMTSGRDDGTSAVGSLVLLRKVWGRLTCCLDVTTIVAVVLDTSQMTIRNSPLNLVKDRS